MTTSEKKKLIGYVYHNGFWYRQYKTYREVCSKTEIVEHIDRVEKERCKSLPDLHI